jgi:precorrin-2 dehydrogenase/sirohydrochlorin ferrochelatase
MPGIRRIRSEVSAGTVPALIEGAFLVIAATGVSSLNTEITRLATIKGILVNSAEGGSDVILPSKIMRGDILVAISTGGHSPAMARYIRQRLEESLGTELADMVRLQSELRQILKKKVVSQEERERLLWEVLNDQAIWGALKTSYNDAKRLAIEKLVKEK